MFNQIFDIMKTFLRFSALIVMSLFVLSFTQSQTIKGKVTDENGNPLPGVSIATIPSFSRAVTGPDGTYKITVNEKTKKLLFSYIGYASFEADISGRSVINVSLTPDVTALQECVVVTGYSAKRAKS